MKIISHQSFSTICVIITALIFNIELSYSQSDTLGFSNLIDVNKEFEASNQYLENQILMIEGRIHKTVANNGAKPIDVKIKNNVLDFRNHSKQLKSTIFLAKKELEKNPQNNKQIFLNNGTVIKRQIDDLINLFITQYKTTKEAV